MTRNQAAKYIQKALGNDFDVRVEDWGYGDRMTLIRKMPQMARFWIEVSVGNFDHGVTDCYKGEESSFHTIRECADYVISEMSA